MLVKRESEKTLCHVLAIFEEIYTKYPSSRLKEQLKNLIESEIIKASNKKSTFELIWLVFFSRYLSLGIKNFSKLIDKELMETEFLKSVISSEQKFFNDSKKKLFLKPKDCKTKTLSKRLAVFDRNKE